MNQENKISVSCVGEFIENFNVDYEITGYLKNDVRHSLNNQNDDEYTFIFLSPSDIDLFFFFTMISSDWSALGNKNPMAKSRLIPLIKEQNINYLNYDWREKKVFLPKPKYNVWLSGVLSSKKYNTPSEIYFLKSNNFVKIGSASDVDSRIEILQVGNPIKLGTTGNDAW